MRIAILGAGAVGGTLAALLARVGHDLELTARGAMLDALRRDGLRLEGGWGASSSHPTAGEELTIRPDLALLTTKAQDAADALRASRELLDGVPVVVVQNGIGGLRVAHEVLPASPLIGGLALYAASYLSPGVVTVTTPLPLVLGAGPGCSPELLTSTAETLRAALPIDVARDITAAQWSKLLINHVNAMPAITGLSVQETIADPRLRTIIGASMRETARIAGRIGQRFAPTAGIPGWFPRLLPLPGVPERFLAAFARRIGDVPNPGSTLQSIRRGKATEIDFLNGAVVAAARAAGLDAPVNATLVALVHEVEASGSFLAPAAVVARVPV